MISLELPVRLPPSPGLIATNLDHYVRKMGLVCRNQRATVTAMAIAWRLSAKWVRE